MGNANVEVGLKQPYTAIGNIVIFRNHCIAHFLLLIYYCNKIFHSIIGIRKVELRKKKKIRMYTSIFSCLPTKISVKL